MTDNGMNAHHGVAVGGEVEHSKSKNGTEETRQLERHL